MRKIRKKSPERHKKAAELPWKTGRKNRRKSIRKKIEKN
jgi:hypothetical protein